VLVRKAIDVQQDDVDAEGATGVKIRWLITKEDGAPNVAMREFELAPGGRTPHHAHGWEHEVYVLAGEGVVVGEAGESELKAGVVVFVPPNEKHTFKNTGAEPLRFLCLVPHAAK
jgi:quercetin dioxygenase-like cupin family protein